MANIFHVRKTADVAIFYLPTQNYFVFSSDFPHEVNNDRCKHEISEIAENKDLTHDDKEAILHRNAERMYAIGPATSGRAES